MKILHVLASNRFSGAENVVCQIVNMFKDESNIEMAYCSVDGEIRQALGERGVEFFPVTKLKKKELREVIKKYNPDIIHAHDMRASYVAAQACGKIPLISHIHNNAFDSRGLSIKSIAYFFAAKKASHIFWVSKSSFEGYVFNKSFRKKSSILYNIIDVDSLYEKMRKDTNEYSYDIVYIGRLTFQKNPERLIEIIEKVVSRRPQTKIAVVGTGELEKQICALIASKHLENNIDMFGFRSNPLKILYDSKVMVMTSKWEGTPMCALEAMALGVPIVSTPVDGLKDLITNGQNGYCDDNNEELTDKILQCLENNEIHRKLSDKQVKISKEWNNKSKYKENIKKVYLECL